MKKIPDKPYFSASEVAALLLVSTNSVRVWSNKGMLKTELTLGGHRRFPRSEIERLVDERQTRSNREKPDVSRILIIDDDEVFTEILTLGLEQAMADREEARKLMEIIREEMRHISVLGGLLKRLN